MIRIGCGYDVHQLTENRKLILGGVDIPYHLGLMGHSDADVLIHSIIDAILGALALGDIGSIFPDNTLQAYEADYDFAAYGKHIPNGRGNILCPIRHPKPWDKRIIFSVLSGNTICGGTAFLLFYPNTA